MAEKFISQITVSGENYDVKDTTARTAAATAQSAAETAQSTADTATTNAATAQSTANTAITNAATAQSAANSKVASLSASDKSLTISGDKTLNAKVNISSTTGNNLSLNSDGLYVATPSQTDYSVTCTETSPADYAKVYTLEQCGNEIAVINIPKDMVVESGTVETKSDSGEWGEAGTYLVLTLANATSDKVYINVSSLIEYVTSGSKTGDMVYITIDTNHKVTASITDGTVTKAKLKDTVQTSLDLADSALQDTTKIEFTESSSRANIATNETIPTIFGKIKKYFTDLNTVAFTGDYDDLSNTPTIPEAYTLPVATSSALGGIKIGFTQSNKNYPVLLNSSNQAYVSVPWTDTTYTLPPATSSVRGGMKIGYTTSGKNYAVQLSNEQAYVNVPWTDTTYTSLKNPYSLTVSKSTSTGDTSLITYDGSASKSFTTGNTASVQASATVATSAWSSITAVNDYAYRASVSVTGMTANHVPEVMFSLADATSGNFAPVSVSYAGGVYIYAKEVPSASVSITVVGRVIT